MENGHLITKVSVLILLVLQSLIYCQENLAINKTATQSSDYGPDYSAAMAVDGDTNQYKHCARQDNETSVWWSVDLGFVAEISYIMVYFKHHFNTNDALDPDLYTRGYVIRVSNSGDPYSGYKCYHDNYQFIRHRQRNHTSCSNITGRYVHFTNDQNVNKLIDYPRLELCEVQVMGCPMGKYGETCQMNCSAFCESGRCDPFTGECKDIADFQLETTTISIECEPGCSDCYQKGLKCKTCKQGYFLHNGSCLICQKYCLNCDANTCHKCEIGSFHEGQSCHQCPTHCSNCTENVCLQCADGYSLNKSNSCVAKQNECDHFNCLNKSNCSHCPSPGDRCVGCSGNCQHWKGKQICTRCIDGFYLDQDKKCLECPNECQTCTSRQNCTSCISGYLLLGNVCQKCPSLCKNCYNVPACTSCISGSFLSDNKCLKCLSNCAKCSNSQTCQECSDGYYKTVTGRCKFCGEACNMVDCASSSCPGQETDFIPAAKSVVPARNIIVPIVLVIVFFVVTATVYRKRKHFRRYGQFLHVNRNRGSPNQDFACNDDILDKTSTAQYEIIRESVAEYNTCPTGIPVDRLKSIVQKKLASDASILIEEYTIFSKTNEILGVIGKQHTNKEKNRYKNIYAYDHSRVVLKEDSNDDYVNANYIDDDNQGVYINANYIDGIDEPKKYIATQGPLPNTVLDFWRMVWQEDCSKIVMLTNLREGEKVKCDQYWPDEDKDLCLSPFTVTLQCTMTYSCFVVRTLNVKHCYANEERKIQHFQYTKWPDHGTPTPEELVSFHRHMSQSTSCGLGPMCVHCSAGVGRTGTFIALDALYENGKKTGYIDPSSFLQSMRMNRMQMIQTKEQYIALHKLLLCIFNGNDTNSCQTRIPTRAYQK